MRPARDIAIGFGFPEFWDDGRRRPLHEDACDAIESAQCEAIKLALEKPDEAREWLRSYGTSNGTSE